MAQGSEVSRDMGSSGKMVSPFFQEDWTFYLPRILGQDCRAGQGRAGEPVLTPLPNLQGYVPAPAPRQPWEPQPNISSRLFCLLWPGQLGHPG